MKFHEKNEARGLVILGVHCQNVPKEQVLSLCRAQKVTYSIYGSGRIKGCDFSGVPKTFAFDWKGEIIFDGRIAGLEDAVEVALKSAPDWLVGPRKFVKCKAEAAKVRRRKSLGSVTAALRKMAESDDADAKDEAAELLGRLEAYANREMKKADGLVEAGDPLAARAVWKSLAKAFKGDVLGQKAKDCESRMKKDPALKKELAAAKVFASLEAVAGRIKPRRRGEDLDKWRRKNGAALSRMQGFLALLEKKYGDTRVCARARDFFKAVAGS